MGEWGGAAILLLEQLYCAVLRWGIKTVGRCHGTVGSPPYAPPCCSCRPGACGRSRALPSSRQHTSVLARSF